MTGSVKRGFAKLQEILNLNFLWRLLSTPKKNRKQEHGHEWFCLCDGEELHEHPDGGIRYTSKTYSDNWERWMRLRGLRGERTGFVDAPQGGPRSSFPCPLAVRSRSGRVGGRRGGNTKGGAEKANLTGKKICIRFWPFSELRKVRNISHHIHNIKKVAPPGGVAGEAGTQREIRKKQEFEYWPRVVCMKSNNVYALKIGNVGMIVLLR